MGSGSPNGDEAVQVWRMKRSGFLLALLLFTAAAIFLFLGDTRSLNLYDEGIILTAAMRVAHGQVIYRDFYYNYGPAYPYFLAGAFKVFGQYVLVERMWFLVQAAITATGIYLLARRLSNPIAALAAFLGGLLWSMTLGFMTLFTLWSTWLLVPAVQRRLSFRRSLAAGVLVGITALFRNDIGVGVAVAHAASLVVASFLRERGLKKALRSTA